MRSRAPRRARAAGIEASYRSDGCSFASASTYLRGCDGCDEDMVRRKSVLKEGAWVEYRIRHNGHK